MDCHTDTLSAATPLCGGFYEENNHGDNFNLHSYALQVSCKPSLPDKPNDNENSPAEETAFIKRLNFSIGGANTPSGASQNYPTDKYIDEKRATAIDALNAVK